MFYMSTKYPLAVPVKAGLNVIKALSLRCETSLRDDITNYNDFSAYVEGDLITSSKRGLLDLLVRP